MTRVKVCGITNLTDARAAIACGVDALGFLVNVDSAPSPRFISAEQARAIITQLPPFCSTVLVTTTREPKAIIDMARTMRVTTVQCHGGTTPEGIAQIKQELPYLKVYKSIHVHAGRAAVLAEARRYERVVDAVVLDTAKPERGQFGGTGETHDWGVSKMIVESLHVPVILAGGLGPDNVREAIAQVYPYAVDANSGVSKTPTEKDIEKMTLFINRAKGIAH
jgi:phosphoribosylanthranilate isomerase